MTDAFDFVMQTFPEKIEVLDKEGISKDKRVFYAEKYSTVLKDCVFDNLFFNLVNLCYTGLHNSKTKRTLINLLEHSPSEERNSGAGWHRDSHSRQFKTMVYLTDVTTKTGNFQWITQSNKDRVGFPNPRTPSYNTRFHDDTIDELIRSNPACKVEDIVAAAGTVIFVDTSYIHRGNIIKEGYRKAITQYF